MCIYNKEHDHEKPVSQSFNIACFRVWYFSILSNAQIFDFELTESDMSKIKNLSSQKKRFLNPPGLSPDWEE